MAPAPMGVTSIAHRTEKGMCPGTLKLVVVNRRGPSEGCNSARSMREARDKKARPDVLWHHLSSGPRHGIGTHRVIGTHPCAYVCDCNFGSDFVI